MFSVFKRCNSKEQGQLVINGKFPFSEEFYKYGTFGAKQRFFEELLDKSYKLYLKSRSNDFNSFGTYNFICFNDDSSTEVGLLGKGVDKTGRIYPTISYRTISNKFISEFLSLSPLVYKKIFIRATNLFDPLVTYDEFCKYIEELKTLGDKITRREILESSIYCLQKVDIGSLTNDKFFSMKELELYIPNIKDSVFKNNFIILPINTAGSAGVCFWLEVLSQWGVKGVKYVFWHTQDSHYPRAYIFFREIDVCLLQVLTYTSNKNNEDFVDILDKRKDNYYPNVSLYELWQQF